MVSQNSHKKVLSNIRFDILLGLFLIIAILCVYWQVRHFEFTMYDDGVYVYNNHYIQDGLTFSHILWAFTTTYFANWHPLTWISYMADITLYGMNPGLHHLSNVLLHIANTLLLFYLLKYSTGKPWRSGFVAALFALHPLHVESVAWISERKDLLSGFWGILTIISYVCFVKKKTIKCYLLALVCFLASLMSKPMLVTLPFILLLADYWPLRRLRFSINPKITDQKEIIQFESALKVILEKLPFLLLATLSGIMTLYAQQSANAVASLELFPLSVRIANALVSYVHYIGKMFWPCCLAVFYPYPVNIPLWQVAGASLSLATISLIAFRYGSRHPYLIVGWLWYLGMLGPVIGFVQIGSQAMADRYTYMPLIGLFIIFAWGLPKVLSRLRYIRFTFPVLTVAIISVMMLSTWKQVGYWENDTTLFKHALDVTDNNYMAHNNLGLALCNQGNLDKAHDHFTKALQIYPNYVLAHNNMGFLLAKQGKLKEAITHYLKAIQINPRFVKVQANIAAAYAQQNRIVDAIQFYKTTVRLDPNYSEAHLNLGILFAKQGQSEQAIKHFNTVLQQDNSNYKAYAHYGIGNVFRANGRIDDAIHHYLKAVYYKPDFENAHNNIGIALFSQGKIKQALIHYQKALQINPNNPKVRENIKRVFAAVMNQGKH